MAKPEPHSNPFDAPEPVEQIQRPLGCLSYAVLLTLGVTASIVGLLMSCAALFSAGINVGAALVFVAGVFLAGGLATWAFWKMCSNDVPRSEE